MLHITQLSSEERSVVAHHLLSDHTKDILKLASALLFLTQPQNLRLVVSAAIDAAADRHLIGLAPWASLSAASSPLLHRVRENRCIFGERPHRRPIVGGSQRCFIVLHGGKSLHFRETAALGVRGNDSP
jgi:hypothetical protein